MITREIKEEDVEVICEKYSLNNELISFALSASKNSLLIEDQGIQGFIIVKDLGGINELNQWFLKPEHLLILKSLIKKTNGSFATLEPESNNERIRMLESIGFKQLSKIDGVYRNEKAISLRR